MRIKQRVMRPIAFCPFLSSKILEEEETPKRDRGMVFPIFFLFSRHNSRRFFYRFLVRGAYFISTSLIRSVLLVVLGNKMGETKGWKGESKMRSWNTKAMHRVDSHRNELLAPFRTHTIPSQLISANVSTRRYLRPRRESRGSPQLSRESILHDYFADTIYRVFYNSKYLHHERWKRVLFGKIY